MTNMSIQPLWLTHFIEILLVLEFQLTKFIVSAFSYKAHFRPQISSNEMSHHTKLDEKLEGANNFRAWKYRISLVLEENELDSYISEEVLVLEGDEAKALDKKKVGYGKEDYC